MDEANIGHLFSTFVRLHYPLGGMAVGIISYFKRMYNLDENLYIDAEFIQKYCQDTLELYMRPGATMQFIRVLSTPMYLPTKLEPHDGIFRQPLPVHYIRTEMDESSALNRPTFPLELPVEVKPAQNISRLEHIFTPPLPQDKLPGLNRNEEEANENRQSSLSLGMTDILKTNEETARQLVKFIANNCGTDGASVGWITQEFKSRYTISPYVDIIDESFISKHCSNTIEWVEHDQEEATLSLFNRMESSSDFNSDIDQAESDEPSRNPDPTKFADSKAKAADFLIQFVHQEYPEGGFATAIVMEFRALYSMSSEVGKINKAFILQYCAHGIEWSVVNGGG